jgi:hypothetical protein
MTVIFRVIQIFSICLISICAGCYSSTTYSVSNESKVYDSIFSKFGIDSSKPTYIAGASDSLWFKDHPIGPVLERAKKDFNNYEVQGGFSSLLIELYRTNRASQPISWQSRTTKIVFLPAEFSSQPKTDTEIQQRCLVDMVADEPGIPPPQGWHAFRPYYTLSKVVFSKNGRHALVKYGYHCAPMSGATEGLALLRLENNRWVVIDGMVLWIS